MPVDKQLTCQAIPFARHRHASVNSSGQRIAEMALAEGQFPDCSESSRLIAGHFHSVLGKSQMIESEPRAVAGFARCAPAIANLLECQGQ